MAGGPKVVVDRELCIGSGMCVTYAPGTFTQDEQAKSVASDPIGDPVDVVISAIEACPMGALALVEEEGA